MKKLTKTQKVKLLDAAIKTAEANSDYEHLCGLFIDCSKSLDYGEDWSTRFPELYIRIIEEISRTGGGMFIHYKNERAGRINFLKKIRKEL